MNHSFNPNVVDRNTSISVAARNIKKGEELTCNYFGFEKNKKGLAIHGNHTRN